MKEKDGSMTTIELLFALLRSEICGTSVTLPETLSNETLSELYRISKSHDLSHIISSALYKAGVLGTDEISQKLLNAQLLSVYRCEQLKHTLKEIGSAFEKEKIPYIPLKGSVLRSFYPEEWMRTSCDIDILVHQGDVDNATSILVNQLGYTNKGKNSHDVQMYTPNGIHVELHYELVEDGRANSASTVLVDVWEHAATTEGYAYRNTMSMEMFYFYHIAHMAKHFESGGCGIRPFIDLWIIDHIDGLNYGKCSELLAKGQLMKFAEAARKLSSVWLEGDEIDSLSQQMEDYILRGGVYGTTANRITIQQQKKGGKIKYAISRIFLPYDVIKLQFPILQKHRWLTPVLEVYRWIKLLCCGRARRSFEELQYNKNISSEKANATKNLLISLGL